MSDPDDQIIPKQAEETPPIPADVSVDAGALTDDETGGPIPAAGTFDPEAKSGPTAPPDADAEATGSNEGRVPPVPRADPESDPETAQGPDHSENLIDAEWLETQFSGLSVAVASMAKRFDAIASQSKRVHEINGELHTQLQSVRGNAMLEMMRPGFSGFVRLIGLLDADIERLHGCDDAMANILRVYRINLANALQDCGLTEDLPTPLHDLPAFSPSKHEVNAVVSTDDHKKNQKIARIALSGFSFGDRRLFREKVDVYRYAAPPQVGEDQ